MHIWHYETTRCICTYHTCMITYAYVTTTRWYILVHVLYNKVPTSRRGMQLIYVTAKATKASYYLISFRDRQPAFSECLLPLCETTQHWQLVHVWATVHWWLYLDVRIPAYSISMPNVLLLVARETAYTTDVLHGASLVIQIPGDQGALDRIEVCSCAINRNLADPWWDDPHRCKPGQEQRPLPVEVLLRAPACDMESHKQDSALMWASNQVWETNLRCDSSRGDIWGQPGLCPLRPTITL